MFVSFLFSLDDPKHSKYNKVRAVFRYKADIPEVIFMSNKERIIQLLDDVPAYKLSYLLAYMQGLTADEDADDAYCEQLYQQYLRDPDRGQYSSEDEVCKELGIAL